MEQIDNYHYEKLDYQKYLQRINGIMQNEQLLTLGLEKKVLGKTRYGYDIDCITIGHGQKELFIVGGTHGSEIIGIDFILNLIEAIPTLESFDPSLLKLTIIPLQNPEGFDISSNTLKNIESESFQEKSYEYYLRYRTDSLIIQAIRDLNNKINLIKQSENPSPTTFLLHLKKFILENPNWKKLTEAIPKLQLFNQQLCKMNSPKTYQELQIKLLALCNQTTDKIDTNNKQDSFLSLFIEELKIGFQNPNLWENIAYEKKKRLYQQMFEKEPIEGLFSKKLTTDTNTIYKKYQHPKGSQVSHDATGIGINLNANTKLNPGIQAIKENRTIYGLSVKNNIKNYFPGPLGTPTEDIANFTYAKENQVLENLIKDSNQKNNYLGTLLYHGTGGMIYYKPYEPLMTPSQYQEYLKENEEIANIYANKTNYRLLEESSTTGYGDYLRRNYPKVLLIELSKMGGNPIGPYGDKNNIHSVFHDNIEAIDSLLQHFQKKVRSKGVTK